MHPSTRTEFVYLKLISISIILALTTSYAHANENLTSHIIPRVAWLASVSPSAEVDSSQVFGTELQVNWRLDRSIAVGFHGLYQQQEYGEFDDDRWGLGLSLNYYIDAGSWTPYLGIKRTYYFGKGEEEEALDCLYCSNIEEDYSGGETIATIGLILNRWTFQVDKRLSDERSEWSENAYDPWGVGRNYEVSFEGIPDPELIFHVGYAW